MNSDAVIWFVNGLDGAPIEGRGLEDVAAGRTISEEEFEARTSKWLEP